MNTSLSKKYILRKNIDGTNILYDKSLNKIYQITNKLYTFLSLFKDNSIDINELFSHLESKEISVEDIKIFLARPDMHNLLVNNDCIKVTDDTNKGIKYETISKISEFTEYTPERVDFLITKKCNLRCKHCFENASPLENIASFDMNTLRNVFRQMDMLNLKTLKITGGEPFYHPQFLTILEEVAQARFETIILTNGMLLTNHTMETIKQYDIKLGISLDGITAATHDYLRGSGSFNILFKKLEQLGTLGVDLTLTFTANRINNKELERLASVAFNELGVRCIFVNRLRPIGRAISNTEMFIPDEEFNTIQDRVRKLGSKYGFEKIVLSDDSLPMHTDNTMEIQDNSPLVCAAGNTIMCMDERLDVYPCIYGQGVRDYVIGNLCKEPLLEIWNSKKWIPLRGGTILSQIKGCSKCKEKNTCGIKNCRLKPVFNGLGFYDHVTYCNK